MSERIFLIESEDGNGYGTVLNGSRFVPCTGASHEKCLDTASKEFYMFCTKSFLEKFRKKNPNLKPDCIKCGKPL